VDDHDAIRMVAAAAVSAVGGYEVATAASGEQAVRAATAAPPDVILLDVMMPGLDGPATLQQLRAEPALDRVPVVFLTAKARLGQREGLLELGAVGVLTKPFDPMMISTQLDEILSGLR